jgi:hypothetical protein
VKKQVHELVVEATSLENLAQGERTSRRVYCICGLAADLQGYVLGWIPHW